MKQEANSIQNRISISFVLKYLEMRIQLSKPKNRKQKRKKDVMGYSIPITVWHRYPERL